MATADLSLRFERSATLDLFLALQRELTGRFAQEISYIPCPVAPDIAQFQSGVRMWKRAGLNWLPTWITAAAGPSKLQDVVDDEKLRQGARHIADAMTAADPFLRPALAKFKPLRAEAVDDLGRLLPLEDLAGLFREALGVGQQRQCLPLYLVPLAPHYPGVGFLADENNLVSAYADCRRFLGTTLADGVLTLLGWALLKASLGPQNLLAELTTRLPGTTRGDRRLRAVLAKLLLETTVAHLIRRVEPKHRPCVDVLGTAWRYPRLFGVVERHWTSYLAGLLPRDEALSALAHEILKLNPRWYLQDIDASSLAADFYLLEWLAAAGDADAGQRFSHWIPQLASYFARQLDLIIGGELGHFERARDGGMPEKVAAFIRRVNRGDSRVGWHHTRTELGQSSALELAADAFHGPGIEYGGEAWGPVAAMLRRYVRHELSHTVFVDQCFTLEHNNGSLFDKYFATEDLLKVLNAQAAGDLTTLVEHASAEVRQMWHEHNARQLAEYDSGWLGIQIDGATGGERQVWSVSRISALTVRDTMPGSLGCGSAQDPHVPDDCDESSGAQLSSVGHQKRRTTPARDRKQYEGAAAILHTTLGVIHINLWPESAPHTVDNFVRLANGSCSWKDPFTGLDGAGKFYDGTSFHRRVPGFLIQGGDRTGTGHGGPGYRIPDEIQPGSTFDQPFGVGMVNTGPNSAGSQFFITVAPAGHLSSAYCQFGAVTDPASCDVVCAIAESQEEVMLRFVEVTTW